MLIIFCFFSTGLTLLRPMTFPGLHVLHVNRIGDYTDRPLIIILYSWPLHHRSIKTSMVTPEHNITDHLLVLFFLLLTM